MRGIPKYPTPFATSSPKALKPGINLFRNRSELTWPTHAIVPPNQASTPPLHPPLALALHPRPHPQRPHRLSPRAGNRLARILPRRQPHPPRFDDPLDRKSSRRSPRHQPPLPVPRLRNRLARLRPPRPRPRLPRPPPRSPPHHMGAGVRR